MSIRQEKRKKNIRGIVITIIAAAVLLAAGLAIVESQTGRFSVFEQRPESYYYSSDVDSVYSPVSDGLAVASSSGLQVLGKSGVQTLSETYLMESPSISSGGKNAVVYDVGGNTAKIFTVDSILQNIKSDGAVISAHMNSSGWTALCTEETGYQGAVYVYNNNGVLAFKWLSGNNYVLSACVSPDNKKLAVLCVNSNGTRIVHLDLNNESYIAETLIEGKILIDIGFDPDGRILCLSDSSLYYINSPGNVNEIFSFEDMHLADYNIQERAVLALNEHKSGGTCQIISVSTDGTSKIIANQENGIVSMAAGTKYTAVLTDTELNIYDMDTNNLAATYNVTSCVKALIYNDGTVIAASRHWAGVYSAK